MDGDAKTPLTDSNLSKFYSGDCYIFQYTYPGESGEEYLVGTWFGNQSVEVIDAYALNYTYILCICLKSKYNKATNRYILKQVEEIEQ